MPLYPEQSQLLHWDEHQNKFKFMKAVAPPFLKRLIHCKINYEIITTQPHTRGHLSTNWFRLTMHFKISTGVQSHIQVIVGNTQIVSWLIPEDWKAKCFACANSLSTSEPRDSRGWVTRHITNECQCLCFSDCLVSWFADETYWNYKIKNNT